MRTLIIILAATLTLAVGTAAQPSTPTLSELDTTKLVKLQLQAEVASLRIALLQIELQRVQSEFNTLTAALDKPGFKLTQSNDGAWVYVPILSAPK